MAHESPFGFEGGPVRYTTDIFRFLNGTPNVPAMYAARSGYEIVNEIGPGRLSLLSVCKTLRTSPLEIANRLSHIEIAQHFAVSVAGP